jgi:acid phosphatase
VAFGLSLVAQTTPPTAILGIGDNIYDDRGLPTFQKMVDLWSAMYHQQYDSLRQNWFLITGNHEYAWNEMGDPAWSGSPRGEHIQKNFTNHPLNEGRYWNMPHFWYKQRFETQSGVAIDAFFIDTMIWRHSFVGGSTDQMDQRTWLEMELGSSTAEWKIVIGHHPVYSKGSHGMTSELLEDMDGLDSLDPLMRTHGVQFYFSGHDHNQQHMFHRGLNYVVSGAGGMRSSSTSNEFPSGSMMRYDSENGFARVQFCSASSATLTFYHEDGNSFYEANVDSDAPDATKEPIPVQLN